MPPNGFKTITVKYVAANKADVIKMATGKSPSEIFEELIEQRFNEISQTPEGKAAIVLMKARGRYAESLYFTGNPSFTDCLSMPFPLELKI